MFAHNVCDPYEINLCFSDKIVCASYSHICIAHLIWRVIFLFILFNGCPFQIAGSHFGTALHHAAKKGLEQTVHLLLSNGGIILAEYI